MQYGIHLSSFCTTWDEDLTPHIKTAKAIGYDGVEFPLLDPDTFPFKRYKTIIDAVDITPLFATGLTKDTDITSRDPEIRQKGINHLKSCIDIVRAFNAPYLSGVTYSPWGLLKSKAAAQENIEHLINSLRIVADYAAKDNIAINLEVLNRFETYLINTVEEGIDLIKAIDRDNVRLHFDTFHAHIEEKNMIKAIRTGKGFINHVHFSENDRGIPKSGQVNWKAVRQGLNDINYQGWICLEAFVNADSEVGTGTNIWRQIEPSSQHTAKAGLANMKAVMEADDNDH